MYFLSAYLRERERERERERCQKQFLYFIQFGHFQTSYPNEYMKIA